MEKNEKMASKSQLVFQEKKKGRIKTKQKKIGLKKVNDKPKANTGLIHILDI